MTKYEIDKLDSKAFFHMKIFFLQNHIFEEMGSWVHPILAFFEIDSYVTFLFMFINPKIVMNNVFFIKMKLQINKL